MTVSSDHSRGAQIFKRPLYAELTISLPAGGRRTQKTFTLCARICIGGVLFILTGCRMLSRRQARMSFQTSITFSWSGLRMTTRATMSCSLMLPPRSVPRLCHTRVAQHAACLLCHKLQLHAMLGRPTAALHMLCLEGQQQHCICYACRYFSPSAPQYFAWQAAAVFLAVLSALLDRHIQHGCPSLHCKEDGLSMAWWL